MPFTPREISATGSKGHRVPTVRPHPLMGTVPAVEEAESPRDIVVPQNPNIGVPAVYNHGGPTLSDIPIVLLYWGSAWQQPGNDSLMQSLDAAARRLASGVFFTGLQEYGLTPPHISESFVITSPQPPTAYGLDHIEHVLNDLIDNGTFPQPHEPGGRNLYILFMPPGTTGPGASTGATGAHNFFHPGVIGLIDVVWFGYVENNPLNTMTQTFGHEVVEACTDPELNAWFDDKLSEIGDVCNKRQGWCDGVWVEYYWSHQQVACILPSRVAGVSAIHPRSQDGAVSLFVIASDGQVWTNIWPDTNGLPQWGAWVSIGTKTFPVGAPVSVIHPRSQEGAVSLFVIGPEGLVWTNIWPDTTGSPKWGDWVSIGSKTFPVGAPVSVIHPRSQEGAVSLFVTDADGLVWTNIWPDPNGLPQWGGWVSIGPKKFPAGAPVSVIHPRSQDGAVSLFVIGTEGLVWTNIWPDPNGSPQWGGWVSIGPNTFPVGAEVNVIHPRSQEGAVSLFVIASDGLVWTNIWPDPNGLPQWGGWVSIGPKTFPVEATVSVIHPRSQEGAVSLFAIGTDGLVWTNFWPAANGAPNWNGWGSIGPNTFPQGFPVSVVHPRSQDGAQSLFGIASDGQVWTNFWPDATGAPRWNGWGSVGNKVFPI